MLFRSCLDHAGQTPESSLCAPKTTSSEECLLIHMRIFYATDAWRNSLIISGMNCPEVHSISKLRDEKAALLRPVRRLDSFRGAQTRFIQKIFHICSNSQRESLEHSPLTRENCVLLARKRHQRTVYSTLKERVLTVSMKRNHERGEREEGSADGYGLAPQRCLQG